MPDHIDDNMEAWGSVRPDLDLSAWAITLRIGRIASHVRYQERLYEPFGLNRGGVETLFALRRSPKHRASPTQLGETMLATSATVTARLDKLQDEGLITRRHDTKDRRGIIVQLTPKGLELADRIVESVVARRSEQMEVLTAQEKAVLTPLLRKLLEHFEAINGDQRDEEDEAAAERARQRRRRSQAADANGAKAPSPRRRTPARGGA
jgi:DNA-binding MarR family transcriptional regulator